MHETQLQSLRASAAASRWRTEASQLWFAPGDPRALACCRIAIFWFIWPGFDVRDFSGFARAMEFVWVPVSFFEALGVPLLSSELLAGLSALHTVAAGAALLGLFYRPAALLTALSGLYLNAISQNFGKISHSNCLLTLAPFVFTFARAADVWSLDAWLRKRRGLALDVTPSAEYRWPIQFIALLLANMYLAAGLSKLWRTGFDWSDADRFARLLLRHHFTHDPPTQLGVAIASQPLLSALLGRATLLLELSAPLSLLGRWPRAIILWSLGLLQLGIWGVLGVAFTPLIPLFVCLLPFEPLLRLLDRFGRSGRAPKWAANDR